jgi:hypothetical protein
MKKLLLATTLTLSILSVRGGVVRADGPSCKAQATDKKLAGAAQNSFMNKCTTNATTACDAAAADKKLAGAAKNSFTKKCVNDAAGA